MEILRVDGRVHKVAQRSLIDTQDSSAESAVLGARTEVRIRGRLLLTRSRSLWGRLLRGWWQIPDSILIAEHVEYNEPRDSPVQVARIVMQPLAVPQLSSLCGQPHLTTKACATIVRRVTLALNYLHRHNTIHFDVACENIGLLHEGDFDSAVLYDFTHSRPAGLLLMDGEHSRLAYASLRESHGATLRPRIDFDQLYFCAARLLLGRLPWERILSIDDDNAREWLVREAKLDFAPEHAFLVKFKAALSMKVPRQATPANESNLLTSCILAACRAATCTP